MTRNEAMRIIKKRNKARKEMDKCAKNLWECKLRDWSIYQEKFKKAESSFIEMHDKFKEALTVIL